MNNIIFSDSSGGVKAVSETLSAAYTNQGIPHILLNQKSIRGNYLTRIIKSIIIFWKNKNEIFILQHFDAIFLGLLLRVLGFNKLINVVHIDLVEYYESIGFLKKAIISFVFFFLKNDIVVFVSKESEIKAVEKFKLKNTKTIYNVCCFSNNERIKNRFNEKIRLGSVSRLHIVKNIDLLIRVFKKVKCTIPNAELLIYGSGDEQEKLEQYIKQQGCADFVKLLGPSNDKDAMYASIDAMVSFSSIEGLPTVILESIGYGKPVLYTDCSSGPRELMSPESNPLIKTSGYEITNVGYLVKPVIDVASYSATLTAYEEEYVGILENFINDVRAGKFSMEYDDSAFSEAVVVDQWLKIIDEL